MDNHEHADDLLRRALLDSEATAAVALRVSGLPLCEELTVVFHGRRDLGTLQTYVTHGRRGAGSALGPDQLMRVPCDLDLAAAEDRDEAELLYAEQARLLRDALEAADTVLDIWREPLEELAHTPVDVDRRIELDVRLPAPSRTSRACIRCPTTRSAASRTSSSTPPSTPAASGSSSAGRSSPCGASSSSPARDTRRRADAVGHHVRRMRRPAVVTAIAFGTFVFLGISFLLARGLTGAGAERGRVLEVVRAQARGDADAVLARLPACRRETACARVTRERVARLRRRGDVQILAYEPSARLSLTRKVGTG